MEAQVVDEAPLAEVQALGLREVLAMSVVEPLRLAPELSEARALREKRKLALWGLALALGETRALREAHALRETRGLTVAVAVGEGEALLQRLLLNVAAWLPEAQPEVSAEIEALMLGVGEARALQEAPLSETLGALLTDTPPLLTLIKDAVGQDAAVALRQGEAEEKLDVERQREALGEALCDGKVSREALGEKLPLAEPHTVIVAALALT